MNDFVPKTTQRKINTYIHMKSQTQERTNTCNIIML